MKLRELVSSFEAIAPTKLAESWDNVGLLAGDLDQDVRHVGLTIDLTPAVLDDLVEKGCDAIYAYHPPIFKPLTRLHAPHPAIRAHALGIAVYSPHTALDVALGGTNDVLADLLDLAERRPIATIKAPEDTVKLVTFVPLETAEDRDPLKTVSEAIFEAGGGNIGDYSSCSFRIRGEGTFQGGASTSPKIGTRGRFERVEETRLEIAVPLARIAAVIEALRASHPYEEPAFDLVQLKAPPSKLGMGRIGTMAPSSLEDVVARIKEGLDVAHVLVAGSDRSFRRVAVAAGSAGSLFRDAARAGAELFVTGEMRHHDALEATSLGLTAISVLHSNSERRTLSSVRDRLAHEHAACAFTLSSVDRDPFTIR